MVAIVSPIAAQTYRVIHVWVDPRNGHDAQATTLNPRLTASCPSASPNGCTTPVCPASTTYKPNDNVHAAGSPLLHAPWPFKTINGPQGALAYVPPLPYTSPVTGMTREFAVIHLLPGIYAQGTTQFFHNGLFRSTEHKDLPGELPFAPASDPLPGSNAQTFMILIQ